MAKGLGRTSPWKSSNGRFNDTRPRDAGKVKNNVWRRRPDDDFTINRSASYRDPRRDPRLRQSEASDLISVQTNKEAASSPPRHGPSQLPTPPNSAVDPHPYPQRHQSMYLNMPSATSQMEPPSPKAQTSVKSPDTNGETSLMDSTTQCKDANLVRQEVDIVKDAISANSAVFSEQLDSLRADLTKQTNEDRSQRLLLSRQLDSLRDDLTKERGEHSELRQSLTNELDTLKQESLRQKQEHSNLRHSLTNELDTLKQESWRQGQADHSLRQSFNEISASVQAGKAENDASLFRINNLEQDSKTAKYEKLAVHDAEQDKIIAKQAEELRTLRQSIMSLNAYVQLTFPTGNPVANQHMHASAMYLAQTQPQASRQGTSPPQGHVQRPRISPSAQVARPQLALGSQTSFQRSQPPSDSPSSAQSSTPSPASTPRQMNPPMDANVVLHRLIQDQQEFNKVLKESSNKLDSTTQFVLNHQQRFEQLDSAEFMRTICTNMVHALGFHPGVVAADINNCKAEIEALNRFKIQANNAISVLQQPQQTPIVLNSAPMPGMPARFAAYPIVPGNFPPRQQAPIVQQPANWVTPAPHQRRVSSHNRQQAPAAEAPTPAPALLSSAASIPRPVSASAIVQQPVIETPPAPAATMPPPAVPQRPASTSINMLPPAKQPSPVLGSQAPAPPAPSAPSPAATIAVQQPMAPKAIMISSDESDDEGPLRRSWAERKRTAAAAFAAGEEEEEEEDEEPIAARRRARRPAEAVRCTVSKGGEV
ncbi:uncharacterized protein KY384_000189 [Bacidia gigantensis]|uniref:uncharacterized protein n=1 Tax=Bacidia gigantensis TaxID=2732470 RepID=UPI001D03E68B|nr:uncharacterized protein KY384_000189 [Bacidia gigantensis]KAG8526196.1 hypothetical protein KY384_000189 [Bacidia gigantensis]